MATMTHRLRGTSKREEGARRDKNAGRELYHARRGDKLTEAATKKPHHYVRSDKLLPMTWFEQLTGFRESSIDEVHSQLTVDGEYLVSAANGKRVAFGRLEMPSLAELRARVKSIDAGPRKLSFGQVVASAQALHADADNAGAMFQVASQFNLLEMTSPSVTPEAGVGIYENDYTQGPACAISCGAGTIYRNYFVPLSSQLGQSSRRQIDCSEDLGRLLGNEDAKLWKMQNGYLFPSNLGLAQITQRIDDASPDQRDELTGSLRIGVQWNTAVTLPGASHRVSQAYCSALPVAYGNQPTAQWESFARLILEATYEATVCSAIINASQGGVGKLFLTLVGGGVFGNREAWIVDAMALAIRKYRAYPLDVLVVAFRSPLDSIERLKRQLD